MFDTRKPRFAVRVSGRRKSGYGHIVGNTFAVGAGNTISAGAGTD